MGLSAGKPTARLVLCVIRVQDNDRRPRITNDHAQERPFSQRADALRIRVVSLRHDPDRGQAEVSFQIYQPVPVRVVGDDELEDRLPAGREPAQHLRVDPARPVEAEPPNSGETMNRVTAGRRTSPGVMVPLVSTSTWPPIGAIVRPPPVKAQRCSSSSPPVTTTSSVHCAATWAGSLGRNTGYGTARTVDPCAR
jgi:hypothetical protein